VQPHNGSGVMSIPSIHPGGEPRLHARVDDRGWRSGLLGNCQRAPDCEYQDGETKSAKIHLLPHPSIFDNKNRPARIFTSGERRDHCIPRGINEPLFS
jgi:hypothetical protein